MSHFAAQIATAPLDRPKAIALVKWYLRSIGLGTNIEELSIVDDPFSLPQTIITERIYEALYLVKEYWRYVEAARTGYSLYRSEAGFSNVNATAYLYNGVVSKHPAPLDLVPKSLTFRLAFGLVTELGGVFSSRLSPSQLPMWIDWRKFGFANFDQCPYHSCEPHRKLPLEVPSESRKPVIRCGQGACTYVMDALYSLFRGAIVGGHLRSVSPAGLIQFKGLLEGNIRLARTCTRFLSVLDFGNRSRFAERPWDSVQVIINSGGYPNHVYHGALYLLDRFGKSERCRIYKEELDNIPLEWMFYAAVDISGGGFKDDPFSPSASRVRQSSKQTDGYAQRMLFSRVRENTRRNRPYIRRCWRGCRTKRGGLKRSNERSHKT